MTAGTSPETRYAARTHIGRVRKLNEDAVLALPELGVWVVADGMGGHDAGDFASQCIVDAIAALPPDLSPGALMQGVRRAIHDAHATIQAESDRRGGVTIGATVVALIIADSHFACLWAGDSRLYLCRDGYTEMLSHDHSLVADLVEAGQLTWDEAEHHPQSNAITRAVGVGEELELDKVRGEVLPGDRFLLCSDGLTKYADSATLSRHLCGGRVEAVADDLVKLALAGGGADNISVIVVERAAGGNGSWGENR